MHKNANICEDDKNVKRFKIDYCIIGNLLPSLPRLFQRDQTCSRDNRKGISMLIIKNL